MIQGLCSQCGSPYEVDSSCAGKMVTCNECKSKFRLPPQIGKGQSRIQNKMKIIRIVVLCVALGLFMLMGVFPPWTKSIAHRAINSLRGGIDVYHQTLDGGYHCLLSPPIGKETNISFSVDMSRLSIQWVLVGFPTIVFGYATRRKE